MALATVFRVLLPNRPGEMAALAQGLADAGVNIETGAVVANGREAYFEFLADNTEETTRVLQKRGAPFQPVTVLLAWVPNHPGALARTLGPLAEADINIDSLYIVRTEEDRNLVALGCSDVQRAGELLASGSDQT